jgi:hypothetical protein
MVEEKDQNDKMVKRYPLEAKMARMPLSASLRLMILWSLRMWRRRTDWWLHFRKDMTLFRSTLLPRFVPFAEVGLLVTIM